MVSKKVTDLESIAFLKWEKAQRETDNRKGEKLGEQLGCVAGRESWREFLLRARFVSLDEDLAGVAVALAQLPEAGQ
ncbi:hypothetical protein [Rubidibacter lacunae]|uniref:hypothetical protein n=1 Tax=Rubidibacter lacunae TaxID=582514 RepID=UPI00041746C7|nr:hypothetical protein [Rubidibacter lacunae]